MDTREMEAAPASSLARDWLRALAWWLGGRRGVVAAAVLVAGVGLALNWSWLVAAGIAPLLLAVAPCAAMCALGVCLNRAGQRSDAPPQPLAEISERVTGEPVAPELSRAALPGAAARPLGATCCGGKGDERVAEPRPAQRRRWRGERCERGERAAGGRRCAHGR
jgi:hypothetical protein